MAEEERIAWIDKASYRELLYHWRFAEAGDPFFVGKVGAHYSKVMMEKREADPRGHVRASKEIGWKK